MYSGRGRRLIILRDLLRIGPIVGSSRTSNTSKISLASEGKSTRVEDSEITRLQARHSKSSCRGKSKFAREEKEERAREEKEERTSRGELTIKATKL